MPHDAINRRHFTAHLAGGAAALTSSVALGADPAVAEVPTNLASVSSLELLLELVNRLDPDRLTGEHLEQLRIDLASNQQRSKRLSGFPLTNADEPASVFAAWRLED